jgi:uncharacterized protein YuzE
MKLIIDEAADKVYVAIHDDPISTQVTHTMEKHGVLLHWDGHGKLMGVEFSNPHPGDGIDIRYVETSIT